MPSATRSERRRPARQPADGDSGRQECEDGNGDTGGDGAEPVLEVLRQTGSGLGAARCLAAQHGTANPSSTPATVAHARGVDQCPGHGRQRQQQPPGPHPALHEERAGLRDQRRQQQGRGEVSV